MPLFLYISSSRGKKDSYPERPIKEPEIIRFLSPILLPLGAISIAAFILIGTELQYILLAITFFKLPIGFFAMVDDRNINERDNSFPAFVKTLGILAGTTGITVRSAMENLDKETIGGLKPGVEELHAGLSLGLKSKLCWEKFIGETGSELINRCSRIFTDAIAGTRQRARLKIVLPKGASVRPRPSAPFLPSPNEELLSRYHPQVPCFGIVGCSTFGIQPMVV